MEARLVRYTCIWYPLLFLNPLAHHSVPDQRFLSASPPCRSCVQCFHQNSPLILLPPVLHPVRPAGAWIVLIVLTLFSVTASPQPAPTSSCPISQSLAGDAARLPWAPPDRPASCPTQQHQSIHRPAGTTAPLAHSGLQRPASDPSA